MLYLFRQIRGVATVLSDTDTSSGAGHGKPLPVLAPKRFRFAGFGMFEHKDYRFHDGVHDSAFLCRMVREVRDNRPDRHETAMRIPRFFTVIDRDVVLAH